MVPTLKPFSMDSYVHPKRISGANLVHHCYNNMIRAFFDDLKDFPRSGYCEELEIVTADMVSTIVPFARCQN